MRAVMGDTIRNTAECILCVIAMYALKNVEEAGTPYVAVAAVTVAAGMV